jgi:hypothetical protein
MRTSLYELKASCLLLSLIMFATLTAFAHTSAQEKSDGDETTLPEGAQYLPAGEGRDIMLKACVQCHDLRNTVSQRKTISGWRRTVSEMVWRGTPLVRDEAETVTRYLAKSFGTDNPISPEQVKRIFGVEDKAEKGRERKD